MVVKGKIISKAMGIHKYYDSRSEPVHALRGVDIEVFQGEILAIVGPSGCGKTTLLNCLSGIDVPNEGKIFFNGLEISSMNEKERTKLRGRYMGFVFQFYNLVPSLTAVENVELPLLARGMDPRTAREKAREILKMLKLTHRLKAYPEELSGGEQQRVAIARAIVNDPMVIWADEPTGALDTETGFEIIRLLVNLSKENGTAVVVVTHDERLTKYADRIMYMDSGKIVRMERNLQGSWAGDRGIR